VNKPASPCQKDGRGSLPKVLQLFSSSFGTPQYEDRRKNGKVCVRPTQVEIERLLYSDAASTCSSVMALPSAHAAANACSPR
jgi:hypothetical protein